MFSKNRRRNPDIQKEKGGIDREIDIVKDKLHSIKGFGLVSKAFFAANIIP